MASTKKSTGKKLSPQREKKPRVPETYNPPPELAIEEEPVPEPHEFDSAHTRPSAGFARVHTPLSCAFRHIQPSWRNYIQYVALAAKNGDEDLQRFVECWKSLTPKERKGHFPEQLCDMANVTPADLVAAVCGALWESKSAEGSLVSAIAHPEVMQATVNAAKLPEGDKARELYYRVNGRLPDKKGSPITIINSPSALASATGVGEVRRAALLDMDDQVVEMTKQLEQGQPMLVTEPMFAAPKETADV